MNVGILICENLIRAQLEEILMLRSLNIYFLWKDKS